MVRQIEEFILSKWVSYSVVTVGLESEWGWRGWVEKVKRHKIEKKACTVRSGWDVSKTTKVTVRRYKIM